MDKKEQMKDDLDNMSYVVGKDNDGNKVYSSFLKTPHLLVAGSADSGEYSFMLTLLNTLLKQNTQEELKVYILNPLKFLFKDYINNSNVVENKVFTEIEEGIIILSSIEDEMMDRYSMFVENGVSNIKDYNKIKADKLPRILVLIHDYHQFMLSPYKDVFIEKLLNLIKCSKNAGIHVVLSTKQTNNQTITNEIKINLSTVVAFAMDKEESEILLGNYDAGNLVLGKELIYKNDYNDDTYKKLNIDIDYSNL